MALPILFVGYLVGQVDCIPESGCEGVTNQVVDRCRNTNRSESYCVHSIVDLQRLS